MMFHLKHVLFSSKNLRKMNFKSIVWFIKVTCINNNNNNNNEYFHISSTCHLFAIAY